MSPAPERAHTKPVYGDRLIPISTMSNFSHSGKDIVASRPPSVMKIGTADLSNEFSESDWKESISNNASWMPRRQLVSQQMSHLAQHIGKGRGPEHIQMRILSFENGDRFVANAFVCMRDSLVSVVMCAWHDFEGCHSHLLLQCLGFGEYVVLSEVQLVRHKFAVSLAKNVIAIERVIAFHHQFFSSSYGFTSHL